jgi:hypothetical protein
VVYGAWHFHRMVDYLLMYAIGTFAYGVDQMVNAPCWRDMTAMSLAFPFLQMGNLPLEGVSTFVSGM